MVILGDFGWFYEVVGRSVLFQSGSMDVHGISGVVVSDSEAFLGVSTRFWVASPGTRRILVVLMVIW